MTLSVVELRNSAGALGGLRGQLGARAAQHRETADTLRAARGTLQGAWQATAAELAATWLEQARAEVLVAPEALERAGVVLAALQEQAGTLAGELGALESRIAQVERELQQATWAAEPDPTRVESLRQELAELRRRREGVTHRWTEACRQARNQLQPTVEALVGAHGSLPAVRALVRVQQQAPLAVAALSALGLAASLRGPLLPGVQGALLSGVVAGRDHLPQVGALTSWRTGSGGTGRTPPIRPEPPAPPDPGFGDQLTGWATRSWEWTADTAASGVRAGVDAAVGAGTWATDTIATQRRQIVGIGVRAGERAVTFSQDAAALVQWGATTTAGGLRRAWRWQVDVAADAWGFGADGMGRAWGWIGGEAREAWRWVREDVPDHLRDARDGILAAGRALRGLWDRGFELGRAGWNWSVDAVRSAFEWALGGVGRTLTIAIDLFLLKYGIGRYSSIIALRLHQGSELLYDRARAWLFGDPARDSVFDDPNLHTTFNALNQAVPGDPYEAAAALAAADPRTVDAWLQSLESSSDPEALVLLSVIGSLDGAPAALRHRANVILLDRELDRLEREGVARSEYAHLRQLRLRLNDDREPLLQLLLFDAQQGRVALAHGDVDTADFIGVTVRGKGTNIENILKYEDFNRRLYGHADDLEQAHADSDGQQAGSVANIVWLGYDHPPNLFAASFSHRARDAAPDLDQFLRGVDAANPSANTTLIGHSFGTTVVGETLVTTEHPGGLPVDNVVAIASPGMRATSVEEFRLPDDAKVYTMTDSQWGRVPTGSDDVIHTVSEMPAATGALGPDPTSDGFGSERLYANSANGHGFDAYVTEDLDHVSTKNVANLLIGREDDLIR